MAKMNTDLDGLAASLAVKENEVMELQEQIDDLKKETPTALTESKTFSIAYICEACMK